MDRSIVNDLNLLLEALEPVLNHSGRKNFLKAAAVRLSAAVGKDPPWTYNYILGILNGNLNASTKFRRAMMVLGTMLDGTPPILANLEEVSVYAPSGLVRPGTIVLVQARLCKYPPCPIWFIPKVPNQDYCSHECRRQNAKRTV